MSGEISGQSISVSVVVPVYRGAPYLRELVDQLSRLRARLDVTKVPLRLVEAIFVDDAADRESAAILASASRKHPWMAVIQLSKNFGQHPATIAGILHSCGDWVTTIDEDLQHPPALVPQLLSSAIHDHLDVVYAHPDAGPHASPLRNISSNTYKLLVSRLADTPVIRKFNSFRLIRGEVARAAASVASHETYFDLALTWFTDRVGAVTVPLHDARSSEGGGSTYSFRGLLSHARRMLISTQIKPLRLGALVGTAALAASVLVAIGVLFLKLFSPETIQLPGWVSLVLVISFFGGLSSLLAGIQLEYMSTLLLHSQGKPTFFVVNRSRDRLLRPYLEILTRMEL